MYIYGHWIRILHLMTREKYNSLVNECKDMYGKNIRH